MKRISIVTAAGLALTLLIVAFSQTPKPRPPVNKPPVHQTVDQARKPENTIATQQRINRYFHGDVVPKLKHCWTEVKGSGTITFEYNYANGGGGWKWQRLRIASSTLPASQNTVALKCMEDSVRGTRFSGAGAELKQNSFVLHWTWPVPFPANAEALTATMFAAKGFGGSGTGGCDGHGAAAACYTCESYSSCIKVCVGSDSCTVHKEGLCIEAGACASGGPYGVSGGRTIAF